MLSEFSYKQTLYSGLDAINAFSIIEGGYLEHRLISLESDTLCATHLSLGHIQIKSGKHNFPIIARGKVPADTVYIGFMTIGSESTRYNGIPVEAGRMRFYPENTEIFYQASGAAEWFAYSIPRAMLQTAIDIYSAGRFKLSADQIMTFHIKPGPLNQLKQEVTDILDIAKKINSVTLADAKNMADILSDALMKAYVKAICTPSNHIEDIKSVALNRFHGRLVMDSEQLVLKNMQQNLKSGGIADFTGYSLRAMEMIFKNTVGMTPTHWFLNIRLNGALRDLMYPKANTTVSDVADKWGFQHLSRFSEQYRKVFRELPSQTLAKARSRQS
ncbi:helix-turn-helix domain-containing protein [Budvicia aquatica]|uniref:AraC family transcriptional regulator n=1 Tax=Budvicia aquatica TaxID=82979 RepID=A0A2C6CRW9_9GAMM|nr:helix-turn-helix domain-containing protein [Budvicia aquatica]PHI29429.1 AraC family transcriptional regulator [Budvicia aquatica]VFS47702.1 transcriptional regulator EutR [Budvicia aquatica]